MDKIWYVKQSGSEVGPFSEQQLIDMIQAKLIKMDTQIWAEFMSEWYTIEQTIYHSYKKEEELVLD